MGSLGVLERLIMDVLWDTDRALTATELRDRLMEPRLDTTPRPLAATTILTVLSRLETKGFVSRDRGTRPHLYTCVTTRAEHTAQLMHQVLGSVPDRDEALARFIGNVTTEEADTLRELLGSVTATKR